MQNKRQLRQDILKLRRALSEKERQEKSRVIIDSVLRSEEYRRADCVMAFAAMPDEVQLKKLLEKVLTDKKQLCLPYIVDLKNGLMQAAKVNNLEKLVVSKSGILSVPDDALNFVEPKRIDLVLVPGAAFAADKYRLGMGAGFYDRFLLRAYKAVKMGIAFSVQCIAQVPIEEHDVRLDCIVTENGKI